MIINLGSCLLMGFIMGTCLWGPKSKLIIILSSGSLKVMKWGGINETEVE